ncbi:MAG: hypothetical protein ACRDID_21335 [Ktedonobacterales bacterium]
MSRAPVVGVVAQVAPLVGARLFPASRTRYTEATHHTNGGNG